MSASTTIPHASDDNCYYKYHHGQGRHVLVRGRPDDDERPNYSLLCLLHHCCDALVWALVLGFLGGAFYLCYYIYNNYEGGD